MQYPQTESYPEVTHDRVLELLNNFSREVYLSLEEAHKYDLTKVTTDDDPGWDFGTAVYFVVTVITTIGKKNYPFKCLDNF